MAPLMPNLATGTNVYRASDGTHGAASATLLRSQEAEDNTSTPANHDPFDFDEPIGDPGPEPYGPSHQDSPPPPPTSPPSSPSLRTGNFFSASQASTSYPSTAGTGMASTSSISTTAKCKQSALHASQQSNASGGKKQWTTTGAVALNGIKESLDAFNNTLRCSLVMQQPECGRADTSPERRAKAMDVLQEMETYLDDDRLVALIDLFRQDTAAADAYLAIKRDGLRRRWVEKQLIDHLGFPAL
jgi:hypothetical protein